ncbi:hypothetical protein A4R26_13335 [Niastella populi]|uniref:Secretion system C-terminal sorting domain-containing protein n=2 Tax=Niastella populi TaxID=550983 RepID=A0A1V9G8E9_9BACT|nr:hypothetical protein A4R26_13335 [Niastella populi]
MHNIMGPVKTYKFPLVRSLKGQKTTLRYPLYMDFPLCTTGIIPYGFDSLVFYRRPDTKKPFGTSIPLYEYSVPQGWKVGNVISTGPNNLILASPQANITYDESHSGEVKIRATQKGYLCDGTTSLSAGDWMTITYTRPELKLTVNGATDLKLTCGQSAICNFTVENGNASCITYDWNVGNAGSWLYNGSAAPQIITTTNNTLTLQQVPCAEIPGNVSVALKVNNAVVRTLSVPVSLLMPQLSIAGPTELCNTGNYILENVPCNASVTWSTATNYVNMTPSGNSVTLDRIAPGNIVLKATLLNLCGGNILDVTKNVKVSSPPAVPLLGTITSDGYTKGIEKCNVITGQFSPGKYHCFVSFNAPTIDRVAWTHVGGSSNTANVLLPSSDGKNAEIRIYPGGGSGVWRVSASNACGSTLGNFGFYANVPCPLERIATQADAVNAKSNTTANVPLNGITLMPNPASSQITIAIDINDTGVTSTKNTTKLITGVRIYDVLGRLRKKHRYNRLSSVNVAIDDLASGLYFVEIITGTGSSKRNLNIVR